jgi:hypothetical protein
MNANDSIRDLLNANQITPKSFELRSTTLFDSVDVLAAAEYPLFPGLTARSGDKALTNIEQANSLPDPDNFALTGLSVILSANGAAADVAKILERSATKIDIGGRTIFEGPLSSIAYQGSGTVGMREIYNLAYPQLVKPAARITGYILTKTAAAAAVNCQVILHGVRITKR